MASQSLTQQHEDFGQRLAWPTGKRACIPYRMRLEPRTGRYVVEQHCSGDRWIPIHYTDWASDAFAELTGVVRRSRGNAVAVCSACDRPLQNPELLEGVVMCTSCREDHSPFLGLIIGILLLVSAAMLYPVANWLIHYFLVVR